mmetsp:Transcript_28127/g.62619  ORF Transcript_28127/g.62619 Transcript_28127/m.62619 type:complete len:266 (-) Transcript_28127:171-968(-)
MRLSDCAYASLFLVVVVPAASPAAAFSSFSSSPAAPTYRIHTSSRGGDMPLLHMSSSDVQDKVATKTGTVAWFNAFRGFGFISADDGSGDIYVHQSNIVMDGFRKLEEGERVGFKVGKDTSERAKGKLYAYDVTELGSAPDGGDLTDEGRAAKGEEVADAIASVSVERAEKDSEVAVEAEASAEIKEVEAEEKVAATEAAAVIKPEPSPAGQSAPRKDYGGMDLEEQAFNILLDLGAVSLTPDPDSPDYDSSKDDELAPENVNIG